MNIEIILLNKTYFNQVYFLFFQILFFFPMSLLPDKQKEEDICNASVPPNTFSNATHIFIDEWKQVWASGS